MPLHPQRTSPTAPATEPANTAASAFAPDAPPFADLAATGLSRTQLDDLLDRHDRFTRPRLAALWDYYRNPARNPAAAPRDRRLAQERGLPFRLTGVHDPAQHAASRPISADDRAWSRKEIVIENDIAWRIHAMVDFLFGQPVFVRSTDPDPAVRAAVDAALDAVWSASGGVALLQDLALLGNVFGYADLLVRSAARPLGDVGDPSGRERGEETTTPRDAAGATTTRATADGPAHARPDQPGVPDPASIRSAAPLAVRVELIEPSRGVALPAPDDFRSIAAYVLRCPRTTAAPRSAARPSPSARFTAWRRTLLGLPPAHADTDTAHSAAPHDDPAPDLEVIGPAHRRRYRAGPDGRYRLIDAAPSLADPRRADPQPPVVHIQNLSQPFEYDGLSEVEPLIPLQDELNTRLSDRASRVTMQSFRLYLAKGIDNLHTLPISPGTIWSTDNPDAQITPFGGDNDAPSEEAHIEQIREALDKQSGVPPLASGVVRARVGNLSSESALRLTLTGLLTKTARKRVTYGQGILRASRLILEALDALGILPTTPGQRGLRVDWPDPLPRDTAQILADARARAELPPQRTGSDETLAPTPVATTT